MGTDRFPLSTKGKMETLHTLIDNLPDGVFLKDGESRFIFANQVIADMMGARDPSVLTGKTDHDFYSKEVADVLLEEEQVVIKTGQSSVNKEECKSLAGGVRRILTTKVPVLGAHGKVTGLLGITRDITERYKAEAELKRSEERYGSLFQHMMNGFAHCRMIFEGSEPRDFIYLDVNTAFETLTGLRNVEGKRVSEVIPGIRESNPELFEVYGRVSLTGTPERLETYVPELKIWFSISVYCPQKEHFVAIFDNITERKRSEERVLSLARFPDENPHPVMRVRPDGSLSYANKASESLTFALARETEGRVQDVFLNALALAWESGEKKEIEVRESSKSYILTFVPFAAAGYVNIYGRDVTEEKALAQRLNQAQKMEAIGQLTGGVAHDFNNVLQAITGYCEVLKRRLPEENLKFVEEITKAAQRAAALTAQLLAFSRKQILRPQIVNTKDIVDSIQKMLERVIGEDIELRTLVDPDTGNFLAYPGQLEQVLLNLAVNARDAMPLGGKLTIETANRTFDEAYVTDHPGAKAGQYVCIAMSDTGIGMDKETLLHMYEPFFTTKEKGKGTGLGLSTVYGIVKQSDGYINCYSEPGKGTTFTIYLPLTPREAGQPQVAMSVATAPRGTETVLLVDDDSAVRGVARIALEEAGYVVIEASGAEEALADMTARNITVALLVTDVVMPRMSGKELSLKLLEICPAMRVLYISGYTADVISHHGILEKGLDYLQKPFSSLEFLTKVREILDRPQG